MTRRPFRSLLLSALIALTVLGLPTPSAASDFLVASTVSAGAYHTCALTRSGEAYCWGYNYYGELGDGTTAHSYGDGPQKVIGGLRFRSIVAGEYNTCALTRDGAAYCWGYNGYGVLGDGTNTDSAEAGPQQVIGGLRFKTIDISYYETCGLTFRGEAYCWGYNGYGNLGDGTTTDSNEDGPQKVIGGLRFSSLDAGYLHTCALTRSGEAYCWGYNAYGELGDGTTTDSGGDGPQKVIGGLRFASIEAGYLWTCGLTSSGEAYCWGANYNGQVGDGTTDNTLDAGPQKVIGGLRFRSLDLVWYHTCGLTFRGEAYCWGYNPYGQLGDGTTTDSDDAGPQEVIGGLRFASIDVGAYNTCGILASGATYCWGNNSHGQIGDGTTSNSDDDGPQRVIAGDS